MNEERKHILIADCDEEVLIELEHLLEDEGFDTTTAWSTDETLSLVRQKTFDLLLIADHPPELSCELVIRESSGTERQLPVYVMEGSIKHPFQEPYLLNMGATGVVQKHRREDVRRAVHGFFSVVVPSSSKTAVAPSAKVG